MELMTVILLAIFAKVRAEISFSIESRIMNGLEADDKHFPYQVGLYAHDENGNYNWGGGSLIGHRWVLTAAHCIDDIQDVSVRLGSTDRHSPAWEVTVRRSHVIIHSGWNPPEPFNDIGLIQIPYVKYTNRIQPIALPAFTDSSDYAEQKGVISGWGSPGTLEPISDHLQYAIVRILSNDECSKLLNIAPSIICIESTKSGICSGDSGGPLVSQSSHVLVGISSFAVNGCESNYPNGLTRVSYFLKWIWFNTGIGYV